MTNQKIEILTELAAKYRIHAEKSGAGSMREHFLEKVEEIEKELANLSKI